MNPDPQIGRRIEKGLLLVLPVITLAILWGATSGAPARFHVITFSLIGLTSIIAYVVAHYHIRTMRVSVVLQLVWLLLILGTAILQYVSMNAVSDYPGDGRLSGLLWITCCLGYALLVPIVSIAAWSLMIVTGRATHHAAFNRLR